MTLNWAWYVFYGHMLGMGEEETGRTSYGMMCDLISCMSIYKGGAEQKEREKTFDEIMQMN